MYIDIVLLLVWGLVAWCVAGEGAFGAALNTLSVVLAGLLAMNFFESFANIGERYLISGWAANWDVIALVGLFAACVMGLRLLGDYFTPRTFSLVPLAEEVGRWAFGALSGYATMAILLTALHTAPLPREFFGFTAERKNLFNMMAPDRQWLGFTQFVSEHVFAVGGQPQVFDGPVANFIQGPANETTNTIWPSFPIRYASRRQLFQGGAMGQPLAPAALPSPAPAPTPSAPQGPGAGAAGF